MIFNKIIKNHHRQQMLIRFIFIAIFMLSFVTKLDSPIKYLSIRVMAFNLICSVVVGRLFRSSKNSFLENIILFIKKYSIYLIPNIILLAVEMINFNNLKGFIYFLQIVVYKILVLYIFELIFSIENNNVFLNYLATFLLTMSFIFIIHSLYIHYYFTKDVQNISGNYQVLPYQYSISLRQRVSDRNRLSSFFSNPNQFALFGILSFFISFLNEALTSSTKNLNVKVYLQFLLTILILVLTKSRASFISFFLFIFFYYLLKIIITLVNKDDFSFIEKKTFFYFIGFLILLIIFYQLLISRGSSTSNRTTLWSISYTVFKDNILFGYGVYRFLNYMKSKGYMHAHNSYLQILASGGIIFFLSYYYYYYKMLYRNLRELTDQKEIKMSIYIISVLIALGFYSFFENTVLVLNPVTTFMLLLIALERNK